MLKKITSRKFILALLASISGLALVFTELGGKTGAIAGIVVSVISTITYVITEGVIDAKAVNLIKENIKEIKEEK